ncbi:MAG: hypothetical protein Q4E37_06700 [Tissierellia bacterium]|nr:hypothetical protein [Tissierellia bacterium]
MKIRPLILSLVLALGLLTACSQEAWDGSSQIQAPHIDRSPLDGRWIITDASPCPNSAPACQDMKALVGKEVIFKKDFALINGELKKEITYNMRKVSSENYLQKVYNLDRQETSVKAEALYVITLFKEDRGIIEVLREKEDIAYINIQGHLLEMAKTKEDLSQDQIKYYLEGSHEGTVYQSSRELNHGG